MSIPAYFIFDVKVKENCHHYSAAFIYCQE